MNDMLDLSSVEQLVSGIGDQISTAINVGRVNRKVAQIPKPNLLDNWFFKLPVNQREVSGTITKTGYFIDRWKLASGSATLTNDGLILDGVIQQIREYKVGQKTVSTVLTSTGVLETGVEYDDDLKTFQIEAHGETLVAAKLEAGSFQSLYRIEDGTLVIVDDFNFADELIRCKRFLQAIQINSPVAPAQHAVTSKKSLQYRALYPVPLRAIPSTVDNGIKLWQTQRYADGWSQISSYTASGNVNYLLIDAAMADSTNLSLVYFLYAGPYAGSYLPFLRSAEL